MPTVFTCEQVEQPDFRVYYADACMLGPSPDQQKVLSNIWMLTERRGATGDGETVVYSTGFLYGAWPDGTPFDGNRYVDRFVVRGGQIVKMDVWNDSAEWILDPALRR